MALNGVHTNYTRGNPPSYRSELLDRLKEEENDPLRQGGDLSGLRPHWDTRDSMAVGYGFDFLVRTIADTTQYLNRVNNALQLNLSLSANDVGIINNLRASRNYIHSRVFQQLPANQQAILRNQLQRDIQAAEHDPNNPNDPTRLSFALPNEAAAEQLLQEKVNEYETALDQALGNPNELPQSKERIAIISLLYTLSDSTQRSINGNIPSTLNAIINNNRAEAWYEIMYGSNANGIHAARRYKESQLFGLYDAGGNLTDEDSKQVMRMYTRYELQGLGPRTMTDYEQLYRNRLPLGFHSVNTEIQRAQNHLIADFGRGRSINGFVMVGKGLDTYRYKEIQYGGDLFILNEGLGDWPLEGNTGNDLLFGEGGNDTIKGLDGHDVIYGGEGDDEIYGGPGYDILLGGPGNDNYHVSLGEGTDQIEDKEGDNRVFINNRPLLRFYKKGPSDYSELTHPGGNMRAYFDGSDLVVVNNNSTLRVILNEDFQEGDFGIQFYDALTSEDNPVTVNTIQGDLTPVDFDLTEPGVQTQNDEWGNVFTISDQPDEGRDDTFWDTPDNDMIVCGEGDDIGV